LYLCLYLNLYRFIFQFWVQISSWDILRYLEISWDIMRYHELSWVHDVLLCFVCRFP
jgi:hypothetical protein